MINEVKKNSFEKSKSFRTRYINFIKHLAIFIDFSIKLSLATLAM